MFGVPSHATSTVAQHVDVVDSPEGYDRSLNLWIKLPLGGLKAPVPTKQEPICSSTLLHAADDGVIWQAIDVVPF